MSENVVFPAKLSSPASIAPIPIKNIPLEAPLHGDPTVKISGSLELICPTDCTLKVPEALFTEQAPAISQIPATSGGWSSLGPPIWTRPLETIPMPQVRPQSDFSSGVNFRSTVLGLPMDSSCNYSSVPAATFNSSAAYTPHVMGNAMVYSISETSGSIRNAQIGGIQSSCRPSSAVLRPLSTEFAGFTAGSGILSPSPANGPSPAGGGRVDTVESMVLPLRVDSAAASLSANAHVAPAVVSVRSVPPTVSFRDILRRSSPSSQAQGFADVVDLMDDVPIPTFRDEIPGILFSDQVISSLSAPFKFSLIGRISGNRGLTPNKDILSALSCTGLLGSHTVRFLPRGYLVLTLSCEEDYLKFWERPEITIRTVVIRFSKWTPEFKYEEDSSIAPVWVRFPDLPLHLYDKKSLYPIAKILGNPVKVDEITADGSRGSFARVCIEIDVLQPRPEKIWVGWGDHCQTVEVIYERVPHFCSHCKMLGHSLDFCSRDVKTFRARRRGPQRQATHAPPSSDQQYQGSRPHDKGVASDSPLQVPTVFSQGVTSDPASSSGTVFPLPLSKRPRHRPVLKTDPNRPISTKNSYAVLQDLPSGSGTGEASTSVAAVSDPVVVPVSVVEIAPVDPDPVGDPPVIIALPSFALGSERVGGVTGMVSSSTTPCLSLPLPARTRSQQRRYFRQKAAQSSLPYGRPPDPG